MSEYFFRVASETVDLVQKTGAGIKGLGGSNGLELAPFSFFPFFVLISLGTRCAAFFTMAETFKQLQENGSRFNYLVTLSWFSILMLIDLDAEKGGMIDLSKEIRTYRTDWRSRWGFACVRLGFPRGCSGAPCLEVEDEEDDAGENERVDPWAPLFIGSKG